MEHLFHNLFMRNVKLSSLKFRNSNINSGMKLISYSPQLDADVQVGIYVFILFQYYGKDLFKLLSISISEYGECIDNSSEANINIVH